MRSIASFVEFGLQSLWTPGEASGFTQLWHRVGKSEWWDQWFKNRGPEPEKARPLPWLQQSPELIGCMVGVGGKDGGKWQMVLPPLWTGGQGDKGHPLPVLLSQNFRGLKEPWSRDSWLGLRRSSVWFTTSRDKAGSLWVISIRLENKITVVNFRSSKKRSCHFLPASHYLSVC